MKQKFQRFYRGFMYRQIKFTSTSKLSFGAMFPQSLSVCMMVQNSEKTLPIALESLCNIYDELIIVDGGSSDSTLDIALQYKARIIYSKWPGNHSQQRNVYLREVKTDWVFVIDSDEFIDKKLLFFLRLVKQREIPNTDNFWIPRKWISPFDKKYYIAQKPHFPDIQCRLFKYHKKLSYYGQVHEVVMGFKNQGKPLTDLSLYHLDLFINSRETRQKKVSRYSKDRVEDGKACFYLPDDKNLNLAVWDLDEVVPSVQKLINIL